MEDRNPFVLLGLLPSVIRGLSDEDIRSLVKSQYRALAAIHHPDKGGKPESFKAITNASERLEQDFEFQHWKQMHLRQRKDQVIELSQELFFTKREASQAKGKLSTVWQAFLEDQRLYHGNFAGKKYIAGFSVFNPPLVVVLVADTFEGRIMEQASIEAGKPPTGTYGPEHPDPKFVMTGDVRALRVSSKGELTLQKMNKVNFDPRQEAMPSVHEGLIELRQSPPSKSYYWQAEGERELVKGKLVGSLESKFLRRKEIQREYPQLAGLVPTDVREKDFELAKYGFSLNEFAPYLPFLEPRVLNHRLVILGELKKDDDLRFRILGHAFRILLPKEG